MASHVIHFEVTGKDGKALQRFYGEAFGWKVDTNNPGGYGMVRGGENTITGGIGAAPEGMPGGVTFYVHTGSEANSTYTYAHNGTITVWAQPLPKIN